MTQAPLIDRFDRPLSSLRLSVTDRCNLRCQYCMPEAEYTWLPKADILDFEEIVRLTRVFVGLGVRRLRVTGGEPLLRRDLATLVGLLAEIDGVDDLALTTNGVLLADQAEALRRAGLQRIDALDAPFDPNEHEAVMQDDGDGEPRVGDVLRTGYALNGRVVRPAMVKVTRSGDGSPGEASE